MFSHCRLLMAEEVLTAIVQAQTLNEKDNWEKVLYLMNTTGYMEIRTRDDYVWLIFPHYRSLSIRDIETIISLAQDESGMPAILIGPQLHNISPAPCI